MQDDEWFERIKIAYGVKNLYDLSSQELRKTEGRILQVIYVHRDEGIGHLKLAHVVGIDRKNLAGHLKKLMRKGLVRRANGKQGKYYPATKDYRGTVPTADLFGKAAAARILLDDDFPVDGPFFRNVTSNPLEIALFMYSNKVGAIITYLLIQSMNPSNKVTGDTINDEEKDLNVQRWIYDALSSLGSVLLPVFKEFLASFLRTLDDEYFDNNGSIDYSKGGLHLLNYIYDRPLYTLEQKSISELMSAFSRSYPTISNELEKIRSNLPRLVAQQINHWEYMADCFKQQKLCLHDYKPPSNKVLDKTNNILHCRKCHKNKYKKNPFPKL